MSDLRRPRVIGVLVTEQTEHEMMFTDVVLSRRGLERPQDEPPVSNLMARAAALSFERRHQGRQNKKKRRR